MDTSSAVGGASAGKQAGDSGANCKIRGKFCFSTFTLFTWFTSYGSRCVFVIFCMFLFILFMFLFQTAVFFLIWGSNWSWCVYVIFGNLIFIWALLFNAAHCGLQQLPKSNAFRFEYFSHFPSPLSLSLNLSSSFYSPVWCSGRPRNSNIRLVLVAFAKQKVNLVFMQHGHLRAP